MKTEAEKINELLKQQPEYKQIEELKAHYDTIQKSIDSRQEEINSLHNLNAVVGISLNSIEERIKELLLVLRANTGFGKAPSIAYLKRVPEAYEIADVNAVPKEYLVTKITSSVDKKKLNADIKSGVVDKASNWITVRPEYITIAME
jgi:tetrahydromethanopterin S-methyltransferase subunit B